MRASRPLLIVTLWAIAPAAWPQTAAPRAAATRAIAIEQTAVQPGVARPAVAPSRKASVAPGSRRSPARHSRSAGAAAAAQGRAAAARGPGGVLALGATDITGNKELPKVMVIVPWKDSLGASGVVKPTDSLLDEVLAPVDRGVFQRQIRYYGQLNAAAARPPAPAMAPSGDTR